MLPARWDFRRRAVCRALAGPPMAPDREASHSEWSFDAEIVGFVDMAKAQIALALRDAETPVAELGSVVADVGGAASRMRRLIAAISSGDAELAASLAAEAALVDSRAKAAAVALQFHDRLVQRLAHAREALEVLAGAVADRHQHHTRADWDRLRDGIRAQYSMEQERVIFDLLVGGASPESVLDTLKNLHDSGAPGHVDLF